MIFINYTTMKQTYLFAFVMALICFTSSFVYADDTSGIKGGAAAQINLQKKKKIHNHYDSPIPADMPDVYYNSSAQQVIIDGTGYVSNYDVEITSQSTWDVVVSTSVNGSYGTIDISSLPDDDYIITIDSPLGNTYEGYFQTY